jgi:hypothetical protein
MGVGISIDCGSVFKGFRWIGLLDLRLCSVSLAVGRVAFCGFSVGVGEILTPLFAGSTWLALSEMSAVDVRLV